MIVFVLTKNNKIKIVEDSESFNILKEKGWKHAATINPCVFLENLHNEIEKENTHSEVMNLKII